MAHEQKIGLVILLFGLTLEDARFVDKMYFCNSFARIFSPSYFAQCIYEYSEFDGLVGCRTNIYNYSNLGKLIFTCFRPSTFHRSFVLSIFQTVEQNFAAIQI